MGHQVAPHMASSFVRGGVGSLLTQHAKGFSAAIKVRIDQRPPIRDSPTLRLAPSHPCTGGGGEGCPPGRGGGSTFTHALSAPPAPQSWLSPETALDLHLPDPVRTAVPFFFLLILAELAAGGPGPRCLGVAWLTHLPTRKREICWTWGCAEACWPACLPAGLQRRAWASACTTCASRSATSRGGCSPRCWVSAPAGLRPLALPLPLPTACCQRQVLPAPWGCTAALVLECPAC